MQVAHIGALRFLPDPVITPHDALDQIVERVAGVCPRPADPLEVTAVLESLGYTDPVIRELTSHQDGRSLGRWLYDTMHVHGVDRPAKAAPAHSRRDDLRVLIQTFSLSSIYAL